MIRLLLLGLLLFRALNSTEITTTDINQTSDVNQTVIVAPLQKVLYLNFEKIPQRVIKGEIFSITLKTLSTVENFTDIRYKLSNQKGLKLLNELPQRDIKDRYYYDTFYFLTTASRATLPDITASLIDKDETTYKDTTILGAELNVVTLNPKKNFSKIIANSFEIIEYKTTVFDNSKNIVVLVATATNSDIKAFKLANVFKQGVESITESHFDSKIIYYFVIDKKIENFSFTYFNLLKNRFELVNLPIVVMDDSVTTQSDLKPKDQSREKLKMSIAGVIALLGFIFILWRQKYIYLMFILIPLAYIAYISIPSKEICIKAGSEIHLLPVSNGTIFEKTSTEYILQKEGSVKDFIKVKLQNNKIGWVKNEDICSH